MHPYGQRVAADITEGVAQQYTIVSGGAFGIDVIAHRMALACQRPTIAVLPSGFDKLYPSANAELLTRIAEAGGLLVSEYTPETVTNRSQFVARNRIVAALSAGVVVIEAGRRSGTLNTAGWANKLGRPLMAVPGPVTSALSTGCHQLIKNGAHLVADAQDVLTDLPARSAVAIQSTNATDARPGPCSHRSIPGRCTALNASLPST